MPLPTTESLKSSAKEFENIWNFPHVVGCFDGKHIRVVCPTDSGVMFFNYKKYFSVVLQGLVDANYKFITVDMGGGVSGNKAMEARFWPQTCSVSSMEKE